MEMDINQVSKYLIDNNYTLSALELFCEEYERSGVEIASLSNYFEDSANFLMFQDMKSVSQISSSLNDLSTSSSDIIKVKEDRIALLEHDNQVLKESLSEMQNKLNKNKNSFTLAPITLSPDFSADSTEEELMTLDSLISDYFHERKFKMSEIAFSNERSLPCSSSESSTTNKVSLVQLLRAFLFLQSAPLADRLEKLQRAHDSDLDKIRLLQEQISSLQQSQLPSILKPKSKTNKIIFKTKMNNDNNTNVSTHHNNVNNDDQCENTNTNSCINSNSNININSTFVDNINLNNSTPSNNDNLSSNNISSNNISTNNSTNLISSNNDYCTEKFSTESKNNLWLFDNIIISMRRLLEITKGDDREALVPILEAVAEAHPKSASRRETIISLLSLWSDPTDDQMAAILTAVTNACHEPQQIENEVIPSIAFIVSDQKNKMTLNFRKLLSRSLASFAPMCSVKKRESLFGIMKELVQISDPDVRVLICEDCSTIVVSFSQESEVSSNFLSTLLPLSRDFAFDPAKNVSSTAINSLLPAIQHFVQLHYVGPRFVDFWTRQTFALSPLPMSSLDLHQYPDIYHPIIKYHSVPEISHNSNIIDNNSTNNEVENAKTTNDNNHQNNEQHNLFKEIDEATAGKLFARSAEILIAGLATVESDWLISTLIPQLPNLAPLLFKPIFKKAADRLVASAAGRACMQVASETVLSIFLMVVEGGNKQVLTLLLSAVAPVCEFEVFCSQTRNYISYSINGLKGFNEDDIKSYISPAFGLLAARDPSKRIMIFKLISDLTKSSQSRLRIAALYGISDVIKSLEESEINTKILPILMTLSKDQDINVKKQALSILVSVFLLITSFHNKNNKKNNINQDNTAINQDNTQQKEKENENVIQENNKEDSLVIEIEEAILVSEVKNSMNDLIDNDLTGIISSINEMLINEENEEKMKMIYNWIILISNSLNKEKLNDEITAKIREMIEVLGQLNPKDKWEKIIEFLKHKCDF